MSIKQVLKIDFGFSHKYHYNIVGTGVLDCPQQNLHTQVESAALVCFFLELFLSNKENAQKIISLHKITSPHAPRSPSIRKRERIYSSLPPRKVGKESYIKPRHTLRKSKRSEKTADPPPSASPCSRKRSSTTDKKQAPASRGKTHIYFRKNHRARSAVNPKKQAGISAAK